MTPPSQSPETDITYFDAIEHALLRSNIGSKLGRVKAGSGHTKTFKEVVVASPPSARHSEIVQRLALFFVTYFIGI